MTQHDLDSILIDLAYARRQLRVYRNVDRALDAIERISEVVDQLRPSMEVVGFDSVVTGQPLQVVGEVTPDGTVIYFDGMGEA